MKSSLIAVALPALLLFAQQGCESDVELGKQMADEWARARNINPTNTDGSYNIPGMINAGASLFGVGGDDDASAAVQAGAIVQSVQAADDLANKALADQDLKAADDAIKKRPDDYHYHIVRATLLRSQGDQGGADTELDAADKAAKKQNSKLSDASLSNALLRDQLNTLEQALGSKTLSPAGKSALGSEYCRKAGMIYNSTNDLYYVRRSNDTLKVPCGGG
jgi:hypothetical protein